MPRWLTLAGLLVALILVVLWLAGGFAMLEAAALTAQKDIQTTLAGAVRRLRGQQPGATAAFLSVCFAYGFLHAAGPGHGKSIIGGYGVARRVSMTRLSGIALMSSLAQSLVAVLLVGIGFGILGFSRDMTEAAATRLIAPVASLAIVGIGIWLVWRGARGVLRARPKPAGHDHSGHHHHDHDHDHDHDHHHCHDPACNHAHGPSIEQIAALTSLRETLALITSIALRPCSGALLVLILCFQLGLATIGIVGVFAMGLGTALVTIAVAGLAIWGREGALATLSNSRLTLALPVFELTAGLVIALTALSLLFRAV